MVKRLPLFLTNPIGLRLLLKTTILSFVFLFAYSRGFSFFPTVLFVFSFLLAYISEFDDRRKYKMAFFSLTFCAFVCGKLVLFEQISEIFSWVLFSLFFVAFFVLFADVRILFPKREVAMRVLNALTIFLTIFTMFSGIAFSVPWVVSTALFVIFLFLFPFVLFREYAKNRGLVWKGRIRVLASVFGLVLVELGLSMLFLPIPPIFSAVLFASTALFIEQMAILHLEGNVSRRNIFLYMLLFVALWGMVFFFTSIL